MPKIERCVCRMQASAYTLDVGLGSSVCRNFEKLGNWGEPLIRGLMPKDKGVSGTNPVLQRVEDMGGCLS